MLRELVYVCVWFCSVFYFASLDFNMRTTFFDSASFSRSSLASLPRRRSKSGRSRIDFGSSRERESLVSVRRDCLIRAMSLANSQQKR